MRLTLPSNYPQIGAWIAAFAPAIASLRRGPRSALCGLLLLIGVPAFAQMNTDSDRLARAFQDRILTEGTASLKTDDHISMYETLVKAQPTNLHYQNLLAGAYIQKVRESMDYTYLDRAAQILANVLAADSKDYEAARLRTEIALERHEFKLAAEYSTALTEWAPSDSWNWGTLGDAWIEMGDYDKAADAYQKMVNLHPDLASYNRAAYFRFVNNDVENAVKIMKMAISAGSMMAENTAWCQVELGKMYLKTGKVSDAEATFRTALRYFPNYHTALAGLAQARAAQNDWKGAIENMRRAQQSTPLPDYAAALFDYYTAAGQTAEAQKQKETVEIIDRLGQAGKEKVNRNLAMIYADHDWNVSRALELAQNELEVRGDIYTYDALAWALYKNKKYTEAGEAMTKAMRFGTPEPMFFYHAGLIDSALGRKDDAREMLHKALQLNPNFDARQASIAGKALKDLS
jgi:tetratricopeptide (TPR) repeat protein